MGAFYLIISVRNNEVIVSNPYHANTSLARLCDIAREKSLDGDGVSVTIYKHYLGSPTNTRALYRFFNGRLVKF